MSGGHFERPPAVHPPHGPALPLRILVVDEDLSDFLLIEHQLRRAGIAAELRRVSGRADLDAALEQGWDLVLSDFRLPDLDFGACLGLVRERWPDLPVILVSGRVGEETAVGLLRMGASDFVLKDHSARLAAAVQRAVEESRERRARRAAEDALRESRAAALEEQRRGRLAALNLTEDALAARARAEAAHRALQESEARYRTLVDSLRDVIFQTDAAWRWTFLNPAWAEITGFPVAETLGKSCLDFLHPDDRARRDTLLAALTGTADGDCRDELRFRHRDGGYRWLLLYARGARDEDGAVIGSTGTLSDVTERRRGEGELRKLSLAVEQSPESVVITDTDGRIEYVNSAFEQVSGYRREEAIGRNPRFLRSGQTPPQTHRAMWTALLRGESWQGELINRRKDGGIYVEMARVSPIRQSDGRITHYLALKEDITDRRRMTEELARHRDHLEELVAERTRQLEEAKRAAEEAARAKSAFLAAMSHEIRTPMNGVLGMVEVLARSGLPPQQREVVSVISQSASALLGIIDDILDFSKIDAGRLTLEHEPVHLAELLEGVCQSLVPLAHGSGVSLSLFVSPRIPRLVLSDGLRLRQILYNLIGNAIKFSGGRPQVPGQVRVRAEVAAATPLRLTFEVADNGIGMSAQTLGRLFRPFVQANVSTTRRYGGTGLGLAICKRLTDMMRGELGVESREGGGSTFTLTVPFECPAGIAPQEEDGESLDGLDCILAGPLAEGADDIAVYLEHAGAQVHRAADLPAALAAAGGMRPPVVVIHDAGGEDAPAPVPLPHLRHVVITVGRRRAPRQDRAGVIGLDGDALSRKALLRAVAAAAGRASLELPREPVEPPRTGGGPAAPGAPGAGPSGRLILVAEDDEINRIVIREQLGLLGYEAQIAGDGEEALRLWRQGSYALLITDLHMPVMDGYRLAASIRHEEAADGRRRLPILALTANALRGEDRRALDAGVDEFLTKPATLQRLGDAVARWMSAGALPAGPGPGAADAAAPADASGEVPVLDLSVMKRVVGDDPATLRELLADFRQAGLRLAGELRAAAGAEDMPRLGAVAHRLKSAARSVGALRLGDLAEELERAAKTGDTVETARTMTSFTAAWTAVEAALRIASEETDLQGNAHESTGH